MPGVKILISVQREMALYPSNYSPVPSLRLNLRVFEHPYLDTASEPILQLHFLRFYMSCSGLLHESFTHMRYKWLNREKRTRAWRIRACRTWHQRPCRCPLRPERAPLALWATPAHASLMATTTTDDFLTVYNNEESLRSAEH